MSDVKIEAKSSAGGAFANSAAVNPAKKKTPAGKSKKSSIAKKKKLIPGSMEAIRRAVEYAKKHPIY